MLFEVMTWGCWKKVYKKSHSTSLGEWIEEAKIRYYDWKTDKENQN